MTPLFVDNDVISKLASCDLLDDAIAVLGSNAASVRILGTFKHRFAITNPKRRAKIIQQIGHSAFERIVAFQRVVGELDAIGNDLLSLFEDLPAIDAGEALLFASASLHTNAIVVTGDKRSLRCLATAESCQGISQTLSGRVVCFEQVMRDVITTHGFDATKRRIIPAVDCDTGLRAAFGSGLDAEEMQVIGLLDSYIDELRNETGALLRLP